jgi:hypothetical protein
VSFSALQAWIGCAHNVAMRSRFLCAAVAASTLSACSSSPPAPSADSKAASPIADSDVPALDRAGWTESVYQKLTETIRGSAGQGKIVVFDFDNTTQARDISEAILAQVQQTDAINPASLSPAMFPPFTGSNGTPVAITAGISDYYDALLDSGAVEGTGRLGSFVTC